MNSRLAKLTGVVWEQELGDHAKCSLLLDWHSCVGVNANERSCTLVIVAYYSIIVV
jgi:hypothetical protein